MACLGRATVLRDNKPIGWPLKIRVLFHHRVGPLYLPCSGWSRSPSAERRLRRSGCRASTAPAGQRRSKQLPPPSRASGQRGAACASGLAGSARTQPGVVPVSHTTSTTALPSPGPPGSGRGPVRQRSPERRRLVTRHTTAQTPRRGLSEWWGQRAPRNIRPRRPLRRLQAQ